MELLANLKAIHPKLEELLTTMRSDTKLKQIDVRKFQKRKERILVCEAHLEHIPPDTPIDKQRDLVTSILQDQSSSGSSSQSKSMISKLGDKISNLMPVSVFGNADTKPVDVSDCSPSDFLKRLHGITDKFPVLAEAASEAVSLAMDYFKAYIEKAINSLARKLEDLQRQECKRQLKAKREHAWTSVINESRQEFLRAVSETFMRNSERCGWIALYYHL